MASIHLPYTLETELGMVKHFGLPTGRCGGSSYRATKILDVVHSAAAAQFPQVVEGPWNGLWSLGPRYFIRFENFVETDWTAPESKAIADTAVELLRAGATTTLKALNAKKNGGDRFIRNVDALRDPELDIHRLMTLIKTRDRLDLEQAASAVVSAFVNAGRMDDACVLVGELAGVLATSDMTIDPFWYSCRRMRRRTFAAGLAESLSHLSVRVCRSIRDEGEETESWVTRSQKDVKFPSAVKDIVAMLLRVRRVAPKDRCLHIPAWVFEHAGIEQPAQHAAYNEWFETEIKKHSNRRDTLQMDLGSRYPIIAPEDDSIALSRNAFRAVQRRMLSMFKVWEPAVRLRKSIRDLGDRVLWDSDWIKGQLREVEDVAVVAYWFFKYQRRLQLKVVSDDRWTRFLMKGDGSKLYQNNLSMKSTFEDKLTEIARRSGVEIDVTLEDTHELTKLFNHVCLLMKWYVDIHGQGDKENLVFEPGVKGGDRGPVDDYNLLCDMMAVLQKTAEEVGVEDVPGPVYKFLAKDIMHWNRSWKDDAFADGKVHGWETWNVDPRSP
jgi:hypothetical protein